MVRVNFDTRYRGTYNNAEAEAEAEAEALATSGALRPHQEFSITLVIPLV